MSAIVAGIDLSPESQPVAEFSRELAQKLRRDLAFVHAEDDSDVSGAAGGDWIDLIHEAERLRREVAHRLGGKSDGEGVPFVWRKGAAAAALQDEAEKRHADLVVVGSGAYGAHPALGSETRRMLRSLTLPLCVVPTHQGAHTRLRGGPVVAPIDLHTDDHSVVRAIHALSTSLGAKLVLAHVVKPPKAAAFLGAEATARLPWLIGQILEDAERGLRSFAKDANLPDSVEFRVLESDTPADALAELARSLRADLLALPAHTNTSLERLFVGSTTEALLGLSDRPVLVYPPNYSA